MATYIRLVDYKSADEKEKGFFDKKNRYFTNTNSYEIIPGKIYAYWMLPEVAHAFVEYCALRDIAAVKMVCQLLTIIDLYVGGMNAELIISVLGARMLKNQLRLEKVVSLQQRWRI